MQLVARHGIDLESPSDAAQAPDERLFACPMYAEIQGAAVVGRVVTGPRAGRPVQRLGRNRYSAEISSTGPLLLYRRVSILIKSITAATVVPKPATKPRTSER